MHVLHLEDDPVDAELIQRALTAYDKAIKVTRVDHRSAFETALQGGGVDIILSDHNVPLFGGLDALAVSRIIAPETPFILVTGSVNEEAAVSYMKAGAWDYLLKDRLGRLHLAIEEAIARARQERALSNQELFLRTIIDAAPGPIFVKARGGKYLMANRALADLYGVSPAELIGRTDAELHTAVPSEVRTIEDSDEAVFRTVAPYRIPDMQFTPRGGGGVRRFDVTKIPLRIPGEEELRLLGMATDVTERRIMEQQLGQAQKLETIGQLASGVAHDFNNALTAILASADFLLTDLPAGDPSREDAEVIRAAAVHAASLTRQLLSFSRKQVVQPRLLDLNQVIQSIDGILRRLLTEGYDLQSIPSAAPLMVNADPGQIEQVILNVLVNARDAMPEGGRIVVQAREAIFTDPLPAWAEGLAPGPHAALSVTDTGTGMTPEVMARVFEPFFTTKLPGKGTGLGLATVRGIARASGGAIDIVSATGQGTTVTFYLPAVPVPAFKARTSDPAGKPPQGTETILLVEDAADIRGLATRMLTSAGYRVLRADGGAAAEALAVAEPGPLHLLLTDILMPGRSGLEVARSVRTLHPEVKILYISGHPGEGPIVDEILQGRVHFLPKPFSKIDLLLKVREVLDGPFAPG